MEAGENGSKLQDVLKHVVEVQYTELEAVIIQLRHTTASGVLEEMLQTFRHVTPNHVQVNKGLESICMSCHLSYDLSFVSNLYPRLQFFKHLYNVKEERQTRTLPL